MSDINGGLVNLYRIIEHHVEAFIRASQCHSSARRSDTSYALRKPPCRAYRAWLVPCTEHKNPAAL
ncbi:hypothetical protein [Desulfoluna spongiiphila]|uniref:hypothetical protein n=1 Tax=Desulfoluna spongiiphila TaxID=419481 RepID=UPI001113B59A|nr:hypothetical protein [Desulfoluna spongiiphila]